jgi:hypothetical protein
MTDLLSVLSIARNGTSVNSSGEASLSTAATAKLKAMMGDNPMVSFAVLCVAAAGQGQAKMEKAYENYEDTTDYYKEVNKYAQEAAEKQRDADDQDKATSMSSGMVAFCDKNNIGYSTKGGDKKHDEDQWQSLRDGLDSEKNIASTDMKMAGAEFDQAAKDCDSSQQMAVDCVKKNTDIFGTLAKTI